LPVPSVTAQATASSIDLRAAPPSASPLVLFAHDAALLALPVAVLFGGALVMQLLAGNQRQLALHPVALPVQLERHAGVALLLGAREDPGDLLAVQQQLARARGSGNLVGAGGVERHDVAAQQPGLAVLDQDVG